jgi:transposase
VNTPEPQPGFQGEGGLGCREGREDAGRVGAAIRRSPEPDHDVARPATKRGRGVFGSESHSEPAEPAIDAKTLHAKTGALTLVNDFLFGALGKAGLLPSAEQ